MTEPLKNEWAMALTEAIDLHPDLERGLSGAAGELEKLQAENARLRGLLWFGWKEMNAIRAMSGVPLDFNGMQQGVCEDYWSKVVEAMRVSLGDDAQPWPSKSASTALEADQ